MFIVHYIVALKPKIKFKRQNNPKSNSLFPYQLNWVNIIKKGKIVTWHYQRKINVIEELPLLYITPSNIYRKMIEAQLRPNKNSTPPF